jgi:ribulose-5-phosphate 4-epimerase/fuculose-1-phosphate aldolase
MNELTELVDIARSLYDRGYTFGTAGNISVRLGDRVYVTPTNSSFWRLDASGLAEVDLDGKVLTAVKPSKEAHFHLAAYRARPDARGVVHLHSCYATAVSCLEDLDTSDAMPVFTPYYAMRLPRLPVVDYYPPGDAQLAPDVERAAAASPALLLRNHGSITTGKTLFEAAALAEEIEEQAKLYFLLRDSGRKLTGEQIAELRRRFR